MLHHFLITLLFNTSTLHQRLLHRSTGKDVANSLFLYCLPAKWEKKNSSQKTFSCSSLLITLRRSSLPPSWFPNTLDRTDVFHRFHHHLILPSKMKSTTSDYLILKELGKGSFGKVFLGENHRGSQRAIKILLRRGKNDDKRRFERECMIHSQLNGHPNIVRYYGCFENQNMMGMLMEVLVGGNLRDELKRRKKFEEYQVISMIRSLLRAIEFMHSKFIAHRDIKLENILIACNRRIPIVKLGDFGLARFAWFESGLGDGAGSPPYMAPEVFSDNGYGRPVDMWALGVVIYTLLSGQLPFGNNESTKDKILNGQFNFDGKIWNRISSTTKSFIRQLFNPDPSQRLTAEMALSHSWLIEGSGLTASPFSRSSDELMEDFQNNEILDLLAIDSTHSEDVDLTDIDYVEKIEKDHHLSRPPLKRKASKKNLSEGKCMKLRESVQEL